MNEIRFVEISEWHNKETHKNNPWKTMVIYIIFGLSWILFSDTVLTALVQDPKLYAFIQSIKGFLYVFLTGIALYFLMKLESRKLFEVNKKLLKNQEELLMYSEELISIEEDMRNKISSLEIVRNELKSQKDFSNAILDLSNTSIVVWNKSGLVVDMNTQFKQSFEVDDRSVGQPLAPIIFEGDDQRIVFDHTEALKSGESVNGFEHIHQISSGSKIHTVWDLATLKNPTNGEAMYIAYGIDITTEKEKETQLFHLTTRDDLTNLNNKRIFNESIKEWEHHEEEFVAYLVGIDNFSVLNDLYGHHYGDIYLKKVSEKLMAAFNDNVYRWNGDEILVVTKKDKSIDKVLATITAIYSDNYALANINYSTTASIGVVKFPLDCEDRGAITQCLDMALKNAKQKGRDCVVHYTDDLLKDMLEQRDMETLIQEMLESNGFKMVYQPVFAVESQAYASYEALIRPLNPKAAKWNIGQMISFAEKNGQIVDIDRWVIDDVFAKMAASKEVLSNVAINISTQTFYLKDFVPYLRERSEKYGVSPSRVRLEITEYSLMDNANDAMGIIKACKDLGFSISLDDFGTEYSSLNYLSKFPIDTIKLDKSYIDELLTSDKDRIIIKNLIRLAKDLQLETVAEGIEGIEQLETLQEMGCDFGQGYLVSKPMELKDLM